MNHQRAHSGESGHRGFTLTELLVVMGVMAVLAGLTAVSYRTIAKDAKLAAGKNTVMAVLDNARGLAMKNNRPTMVMFKPRFINEKETRVTAYIAEWKGGMNLQTVAITTGGGSTGPRLFERFTPVPKVNSRDLPAGISIAGPNFRTANSSDDTWFVPSNVAKPTEAPGRAIAVLYGADGSTLTSLPATATVPNNYQFVDFDGDGVQDRTLSASVIDIDSYFIQLSDTDEPCAEIVPYLAIFDEEQARGFYGDDDWNDDATRLSELSQYITANANRIHFNRYTGVAMK